MFLRSSVLGVGSAIWYCKGKVIAVCSLRLQGFFPPEVGQFLAIRQGDGSSIVLDIKALCAEASLSKCQAIPCSGNSLALNLALLAFSSAR
ncbi:hypothetical protein Q3G72_029075 [Acer saccharum]|nr:hypothetical protein Q3G72_029075 [Acer saccharum]